MLAADRDIFELPIQTRLQDHSPHHIALWIQRAKPIVATSIKQASKAIQRNFHLITAFFAQAISCTLKESLADPPPAPPYIQNLKPPD
jgi:hypothetical protein